MTEYKDMFPEVHTEQGKKALRKLERGFTYAVFCGENSRRILRNGDYNPDWLDEIICRYPEIEILFNYRYHDKEFQQEMVKKEREMFARWLKAKNTTCIKCFMRQKREYQLFECCRYECGVTNSGW